MKTWEDWSDYEVNKAAVKFLDINFEDMSDFCPEPYLFNEDSQREFNLCNSWEDMGPIIVENNISLINDGAGNIGAAHDDFKQVWLPKYRALRAAAIVFLMMNGVNPE